MNIDRLDLHDAISVNYHNASLLPLLEWLSISLFSWQHRLVGGLEAVTSAFQAGDVSI